MVWSYGDSSESEEERTDRFRSERLALQHENVNALKTSNSYPSGNSPKEPKRNRSPDLRQSSRDSKRDHSPGHRTSSRDLRKHFPDSRSSSRRDPSPNERLREPHSPGSRPKDKRKDASEDTRTTMRETRVIRSSPSDHRRRRSRSRSTHRKADNTRDSTEDRVFKRNDYNHSDNIRKPSVYNDSKHDSTWSESSHEKGQHRHISHHRHGSDSNSKHNPESTRHRRHSSMEKSCIDKINSTRSNVSEERIKRKSKEHNHSKRDKTHSSSHSPRLVSLALSNTEENDDLTPYSKEIVTIDACGYSSDSENNTNNEFSFGPALPPRRKELTAKEKSPLKKVVKCKRKASKLKENEASDMKEKLVKLEESKSLCKDTDEAGNKTGDVKMPESSKNNKDIRAREENLFGPKLPEKFQNAIVDQDKSYGPVLPPSHKVVLSVNSHDKSDVRKEEEISDDDNPDDLYGPALPGAELTPAQLALQHRANLLSLHNSEKNSKDKTVNKREDWMLTLPDKNKLTGMGLTARTFKAKESDAKIDQSWTDTPEEKERKELLKKAGVKDSKSKKDDKEVAHITVRDKAMEKLASNYKKHKDKSLLEMHQDKLKKKKKDQKETKVERRPFSREIDLNVRQLSDAQKKSIYKKAATLDSRFSAGHAKYL